MLSRKDFIALARAMQPMMLECPQSHTCLKSTVLDCLVAYCKQQNRLFDENKFRQALQPPKGA